MTPRFFRRHFRMYKEGLKSVTNYLSHLPIIKEYQETTRVSLGKQVAMTMAYLGSKSTTVRFGKAMNSHMKFFFSDK